MAIFPSPFPGALTFTLYSPSWLALHLLVRQVPTSVPIPSAVPPYFLLVAMIEVTLPRRLFSLTWLGRWRVHLMRRGRIYPEPVLHRTPTWVPFYSHLLQEAFWGRLFGGGFHRDVALPPGVLEYRGQGHPWLFPSTLWPFSIRPRYTPSSAWARALIERGPDHKFPGSTIAPQNPAIRLLGRIGGF